MIDYFSEYTDIPLIDYLSGLFITLLLWHQRHVCATFQDREGDDTVGSEGAEERKSNRTVDPVPHVEWIINAHTQGQSTFPLQTDLRSDAAPAGLSRPPDPTLQTAFPKRR